MFQKLITIYNKWTHAEAVYNPVRCHRPGAANSNGKEAAMLVRLCPVITDIKDSLHHKVKLMYCFLILHQVDSLIYNSK